jgi:TLC domain
MAVMIIACEMDLPHFIAPLLTMEVSTIFLTLVRAKIFSKQTTALVQALFAVSFFFFRIILVPIMWLRVLIAMYTHREASSECIPRYFPVLWLTIGCMFNGLNGYWFLKIVKKAKRQWFSNAGTRRFNDADSYDREWVMPNFNEAPVAKRQANKPMQSIFSFESNSTGGSKQKRR